MPGFVHGRPKAGSIGKYSQNNPMHRTPQPRASMQTSALQYLFV
jgi:hypothetical protein